MPQKEVVFLGSKPVGFACFEYLLQQQAALGCKVIALATRQRTEFSGNSDLTALARAHGVPVLGSLEELPSCDIIYSVQHHELLRAAHLSRARQYAVNLHLAPLPEYRGCNQFSFAILDGAREFGATIHLMDARIDHGAVLFEKRFAIAPGCWVADLYAQTVSTGIRLFKDTLLSVVSGDVQPVSQEALKAARPSFLHFREEMAGLKEISLDWDGEKIERHIRAASMPGFEPPYCMIGNEKVYFKKG